MRKQTGFDVVSENLGSGGVDKQVLLGRVQRYLDAGWEVLSTHIPQTGANTITITVTLVKYETVGDVVPAVLEEKRGPGRPPKKEEVVPA